MRALTHSPFTKPATAARRRRAAAFAGLATALLLGCAPGVAAATTTAATPVTPAMGKHQQGTSAPPAAPVPLQADPDALYTGVGVNGRGVFSLMTNALGNVSFYNAEWNKTVCGIPQFALWFDAAESSGIPVDGAGIFIVSYTITYRSQGRRYTVQARDSAQIGLITGFDGVTRDQVTFKQVVKVKRQAKGAKWCSGVHKKKFIGFRVSGGA